jgi:uncharacterized protein YecE (DUF72 family)
MHWVGYDGWQGPFYPKSMAKSEFLKHYSSIFDITEINSTFYAISSQVITKKWNAETPHHFKFTAKLTQTITQAGQSLAILGAVFAINKITRHKIFAYAGTSSTIFVI